MKKIISVLLVVLLLLPTFAMAASPFPDVPEGELGDKIALLKTLGIVSGNTDGTYRPNDLLTRAQFTKLVVCLLGRESGALSYGGFTIFPDVSSSHWAASYVNFSARELKLVMGDTGTGAFRPESDISYAEAVTIILRALGYTDADVGFNWPNGYIERAAAIGLADDISLTAYQTVNRANGAVLFYNALFVAAKDGKRLIDSYVGESILDALVVAVDAVASDGTQGCVRLDGRPAAVKTDDGEALPASLIGKRVDLTLNKDGEVMAVSEKESTSVTISVSYADSDKVTAVDGATYKIPETVRIFTEDEGFTGETTSYSKIRTKLNSGDALTFVYKADGTLDYVLLNTGAGGAIAIIGISATSSNIYTQLGAPRDATIYKNGSEITASQLQQYDVATYNAASDSIFVSDFKLRGIYEAAFPNASAPRRVTTLGNEFELEESAAASLVGMKVGDYFVLLFTADNRVARVMSGSTSVPRPAGLYDGANVAFIGGPTIKLKLTGIEAGELVTIGANGEPSRVSGRNVTDGLDLDTNMLGDKPLAVGCALFECVDGKTTTVKIERSDLTKTQFTASEIYSVSYDTAGNPYIIILNDVTGDRYAYGELTTSSRTAGSELTYTEYLVTVTGASGKQDFVHPTTTLPKEGWGGVAASRDGNVVATVELTRYKGVTRTDFVGTDSIYVDGIAVPIAGGVQVYINATKTYMTADSAEELIADTRISGTSFDVLLDKAPEDGGKVRVIVVY